MRVLVLPVPSPHEALSSGGPHVPVDVPSGETIAPPQNDRAKRRTRLGLEFLEAREVPAFFTVADNGDAGGLGNLASLTLRQAINRANAGGAGGHTINFALVTNTITLGSQLPTITVSVTINGTIVTPGVDGAPPTYEKVTVQRDTSNPNNKFRLFEIANTGSASFQALRLLNGNAGAAPGGAILSDGSSLSVAGCEVRDNAADRGGGIAARAGTFTVSLSTIHYNTATLSGGGVYFSGTQMQMSDTSVLSNSADAAGGGIYLRETTALGASVTLNHVEVAYNSTNGGRGSGIWSDVVTLNLTNNGGATSIHDNSGADKGGGIYVAAGTCTGQGVIFQDNQASSGLGAGIYQAAGAFVVDDQPNGGISLLGGDDWYPE